MTLGRISRWIGVTVLLLSAMLLASGGGLRAQQQDDGVEIVFAFGPDETGAIQQTIDAFNEAHRGEISVRWVQMARESDAFFSQIRSALMAESRDIDVLGADVIWTAEFAENELVEDISSRFHDAFDAGDFVGAALNSAGWGMRVWGVPFYTDAGLLFYRKDLLEASGYTEPPETWAELKEMALKVKQDAGIPHGFVFQGAEYEGGVTNMVEYIWSAGGRVWMGNLTFTPYFGAALTDTVDPNEILVDSPEAATGLEIARSMIEDGVAPPEVATMREQESMEVFLAGDAVFMRNWPYVYGRLADPEQSEVTPEQVGVASIPVHTSPHSRSCLGGWNLMINEASRNKAAAWEFIKFATSPEQQKNRAVRGGFLPTLLALYEDEEIRQGVPVVAAGRDALGKARARPSSPFYSEFSPRMQWAFNRVLRGEVSGERAAESLARELRAIQRKLR